MTDPLAYFPRFPDGSLRGGIYQRIARDEIEQALKDGAIPVHPRCFGPYELEVIWVTWIECACGRAMPVPR